MPPLSTNSWNGRPARLCYPHITHRDQKTTRSSTLLSVSSPVGISPVFRDSSSLWSCRHASFATRPSCSRPNAFNTRFLLNCTLHLSGFRILRRSNTFRLSSRCCLCSMLTSPTYGLAHLQSVHIMFLAHTVLGHLDMYVSSTMVIPADSAKELL